MNVVDLMTLRKLGNNQVYYKEIVDEASAAVTYTGFAPQGTATSSALWTIFRVTISGTVTTIEMAPINSIWDNRASLTYT